MSTLAPENTIPAFELMHKYGANWLETDLGITKD
ncbi:MAG: glycerophosphoryl diester phosphodiesterase, partial [Lactobacillus sp.]|nr:glycerophosphoryl diester phosphodiesterase [Lactobacillus sp.]MCI1330616.1 glycerophosphoryl diester phosphodiesterase [Lactobacillus sp.]